jgi:hypothetical protein
VSKPPTIDQIIAKFRHQQILFVGSILVAAFSFIGLMVLAGFDGFLVWGLRILAIGLGLSALICAITILRCPSCGQDPIKGRNIFPARCHRCGVRLR